MGNPWRILGGSSEVPWMVLGSPGGSWEDHWSILGSPLGDPWKNLGGFLEDHSKFLWGSVEVPWRILGGSWEVPWGILGGSLEDLSNFLGNQRQDNKVDAVEFAGAHWQRNVSKQSPAIGSKNAHPGLGGGSFFLEICVKSAHPQQKKLTKLGTLGLGGGHFLIKNRAENSYATTFPEPNLILPRVWLCRLLALTWAVSTSVPSSPSAWILVNFGVAWDHQGISWASGILGGSFEIP